MNIQDKAFDKKLNSEQLAVLRDKATEAPFSGKFLDKRNDGSYACAACGAILFDSEQLYDSTIESLKGWPSFAAAKQRSSVRLEPDTSHGMERTEVVCAACGGHLGHVFPDESSPSGEHYCINSVSLSYVNKDANDEKTIPSKN